MTQGGDPTVLAYALAEAGYLIRRDQEDPGIARIYRPAAVGEGGRGLLVGMFVIRNHELTYVELPAMNGGTRVYPFHRLTSRRHELERILAHIKDTPA